MLPGLMPCFVCLFVCLFVSCEQAVPFLTSLLCSESSTALLTDAIAVLSHVGRSSPKHVSFVMDVLAGHKGLVYECILCNITGRLTVKRSGIHLSYVYLEGLSFCTFP